MLGPSLFFKTGSRSGWGRNAAQADRCSICLQSGMTGVLIHDIEAIVQRCANPKANGVIFGEGRSAFRRRHVRGTDTLLRHTQCPADRLPDQHDQDDTGIAIYGVVPAQQD